MTVEIEGGTTIGELCRYLAPRGCALPNLPSLPHITVARHCPSISLDSLRRPVLERASAGVERSRTGASNPRQCARPTMRTPNAHDKRV